MENSGGAKPKQMQQSTPLTNSNKKNHSKGSQKKDCVSLTPSIKSQKEYGRTNVKTNKETDHNRFSANLLLEDQVRRNYSGFQQHQTGNNTIDQKRMESTNFRGVVLPRTDKYHKQTYNAQVISFPLQNGRMVQTSGKVPFCHASNSPISNQNYSHRFFQSSKRETAGKDKKAANTFFHSESNKLPHYIPNYLKNSSLSSGYERLKHLKSSLLNEYDQQIRKKDKEIAHSTNGDIKEILKIHLRILDKKKNAYIEQMENIFKRLQVEPSQLSLIQEEFDRSSNALMEKCWLSAYRNDILQALTSSQVLIITGDIGYGKSTLLPLYASEICSKMGTIASCQPFHVTVMTLAKHLAELLGTPLGKDVGYNLGKDKTLSSNTNILFTTYHRLLEETLDSPFLSKYSCVILDDCHDRSVEADVFLCKTKEILQQRPNFKLILISSHHDDGFEKFFTNGEKVTVISLPQITFPVSVCWNNLRNPNLYIERAVELIKSIHLQKKSGNIVVFLSTMQETQKAYALVKEKLQNEVLCFSLHSKTSIDEINELFSLDPKRKIVFSTECAESINLPNIYFIIDSGKIKEKIYNTEKQKNIISASFISKEKAERRRQLAGHVQSGYCYRLYTESIYSTDMPEKSLPLISKVNPANLVLTMLYYNIAIPPIANFISPIEKEVLKAGALILKNYGAVKDDNLTKLGRTMAVMPFDLKHAELVTLGIENGFGFETIVIAMLSTLNTPIFNTVGESKDVGKHSFFDPDGDYFAILDVYLKWKENFSEKWCIDNGISHLSLASLHKKVTAMITVLNINAFRPQTATSRKKLIGLICKCFCDNLCVYTGHFRLGYKSVNNGNTLRIHSSSTFCYKSDKPSQYLVYDYAIDHGIFDFMVNITPVPVDIVTTMLKNRDTLKESCWDHKMDFVVIEPVGEMFIKQEILGKQGKKLKILEDEVRKNLGCDTIIIDPNAESGRIEIYAYSEYLKPAKGVLLKHLEMYLEKLKLQEEEITMPTGNVVMKMSWGQGGMITKVSGTVSEHPSQEKVSNEQESVYSIVHNYSINLMWRRRLCKGMGFVTFKCTEDFDRAHSCFLSGKLKVCGKDVKSSISRKAPNQFFIEDLLPETSNEDLKEAVENHIGFNVESATIVCSPPFSTSQEDIEVMKHILLLQFVRYVQYGNLNIHIETPNSIDTTMKAYLNFDNDADVTLTLNAVERDGIKTFQDIPLNYEQVYRTTIVCVLEHYKCVKTDVEKLLGIREKGISQNLKFVNKFKFSTRLENSKIQLKLLTNDYSVMQKVEKIITDSLKGQKLEGFSINELRKLFSHSGQQWLKQTEKTANCYILQNFKQKTLNVCGTKKSYDHIMCKIKGYLRNMENEIVSIINIGEKNFSRQAIKTLVIKYGITLKEFIIECNLISVEFNVQYGQMTLYGTPDSIEKAEKLLESLVSQSQTPLFTDENEEICPVCFTVPTTGLLHRLEYCGHLYCSDCLKLLVAEKSIPLKCCKEDCQKELVIEDILDVLEGNEKETQKLLYHSLNVYVEKNYKHVKLCPTPDCSMIYDMRSLSLPENSDLWTCPACRKVICTRCNIEEHPGISCDMAKNMKEDVDYSLKVWMANNLETRKCCPNCKSPIEKNGGCNHMTCWKCRSHLCWLCLQIFKDSNLVYNHLPYCSQNQRPYV